LFESSIDSLITFITFILITVIIFFAVRQIILWYWRVDHIVNRLDSIDKHLKMIAMKIGTDHNTDIDPDNKLEDSVDENSKSDDQVSKSVDEASKYTPQIINVGKAKFKVKE
jgi:hypothetical protein